MRDAFDLIGRSPLDRRDTRMCQPDGDHEKIPPAPRRPPRDSPSWGRPHPFTALVRLLGYRRAAA
jgi:hypothetical protein